MVFGLGGSTGLVPRKQSLGERGGWGGGGCLVWWLCVGWSRDSSHGLVSVSSRTQRSLRCVGYPSCILRDLSNTVRMIFNDFLPTDGRTRPPTDRRIANAVDLKRSQRHVTRKLRCYLCGAHLRFRFFLSARARSLLLGVATTD